MDILNMLLSDIAKCMKDALQPRPSTLHAAIGIDPPPPISRPPFPPFLSPLFSSGGSSYSIRFHSFLHRRPFECRRQTPTRLRHSKIHMFYLQQVPRANDI